MYINGGINKKTHDLLIDSIECSDKDIEYLKKLGQLYFLINQYTMKRDNFFIPFVVRRQFDNIHDDLEEFSHYKDDDFDFYFGLLSDRIDNKRLIRELKSSRRFHKCHESAIGISLNDKEGNTSILTGYMPTINNEILHSVVEMKDEDVSYIIDYTQNLVMEKETYIRINHFRIINSISSKELRDDCSLVSFLSISCPFYLVFREEILKDLKKNNKVLKLED